MRIAALPLRVEWRAGPANNLLPEKKREHRNYHHAPRLATDVRKRIQRQLSAQRRRIVAQALATGRITKWDHPEGDARYIDTGDDFWPTLERNRRP